MNIPKPYVKLIYHGMRAYWWIFRPIRCGVRVMLVKNEKIILIKPKYKERWNFPGGGVKKRETLNDAAQREVYEECNVKIKDLELIGLYTNLKEKKTDHIALFISDNFIEEKGSPSWEIEEKRSFKINELPENISVGAKNKIDPYLKNKKSQFGHW